MIADEIIRQECGEIIGEAGLADVEAYCAANGITLAHYLEAIATAPGGACDLFGVHVDEASGRRMAMLLKASRMLKQAESLQVILSGDAKAMFDPGRGV